jgi:hypothetical protein
MTPADLIADARKGRTDEQALVSLAEIGACAARRC